MTCKKLHQPASFLCLYIYKVNKWSCDYKKISSYDKSKSHPTASNLEEMISQFQLINRHKKNH